MLHYFSELGLLCEKYARDNQIFYWVLNGAWEFTIRNGNIYSLKKNLGKAGEIQEFTREQFDEQYPHFGY